MSLNKKKLLIAGGGYADIPLIQAGKALGFHVITSGNRPDDLGHCYSDECRFEDFSDERAMLRLAQSLQIDAICACCNDFSALSCAYVAEQMGLPGHDSYETAQIIHHKDRYRVFAHKNEIASPYAKGFNSVESALLALDNFHFPVMIKPVDLTGGKGISKIQKADDARSALEAAFRVSRVQRVVIEEFIEGSRHGLSTFIRDGKVVFYFNDNEYYFLNPYLVSAASTPGNVSTNVVMKLCTIIEHFVSLLALKTGIVHVQYILNESGQPIIIEICRRAPGDLYTSFVQYATGINYPSYIVRAAAGIECDDLVHAHPKSFFTRHCVMTSHQGKVRDVIFDPNIQKNLVGQFMWWKAGDIVNDFLTQKFGIVFLHFDTMEEMLTKTEKMQDLIRVDFD
ncbi:acetyl-CoA carboxylase biotin carboxylase subunit family protein [Chromatium okenii]|jgi:biotin carboxylase|uniref:ATP-grasp domain-containing protein n=1 Tax=Chromatium okenii TaxID=61644 RepID=UPI0026EB0299|nr:ATP-grasp domain-containing protein [Chromatium okenii]MBV5309733.1 ATP-grasp domain-containing protein [Chromatium okenii]